MSSKRKLVTILVAVLLLAGMAAGAFAAVPPTGPNEGCVADPFLVDPEDAQSNTCEEPLQLLPTNDNLTEVPPHVAGIVQSSNDGDPDFGDAADALRSAADNVENSSDTEQSQDVRATVAAMLMWIASTLDEEEDEFQGQAFGEEVSDLARQITGDSESLPD